MKASKLNRFGLLSCFAIILACGGDSSGPLGSDQHANCVFVSSEPNNGKPGDVITLLRRDTLFPRDYAIRFFFPEGGAQQAKVKAVVLTQQNGNQVYKWAVPDIFPTRYKITIVDESSVGPNCGTVSQLFDLHH
jgi:hypothetical protein